MADYPVTGEKPWGQKLKGYIDATALGAAEIVVPPLVSQALADDPTVADAAALAADEALRAAGYGPNETVFSPAAGETDLNGNGLYGYVGSNFNGHGRSKKVSTATSFNQIDLKGVFSAGAAIKARIWVHSTQYPVLHNLAPALTVDLAEGDVPRRVSGTTPFAQRFTLTLPSFIEVPANHWVTIVFTSPTKDAVYTPVWTVQDAGATRNKFVIATGENLFTYGTDTHLGAGFYLHRATPIGKAQDTADAAHVAANEAKVTATKALSQSASEVWQDGEHRFGNGTYQSTFYGYGQRIVMDKTVRFDTVALPFYVGSQDPAVLAKDVLVKVYTSPVGAPVDPPFLLAGTADYILRASTTIPAAEVPRTAQALLTDTKISLPETVTVNEGETLTVLLYTTSEINSALGIKQFNTLSGPAPSAAYKRWLLFNTLTTGTYGMANYISAGFLVGMEDEIALREAAFRSLVVTPPRVLLPSVIDMVVGEKTQVFTKAVIEHVAPETIPHAHVHTFGSAFTRHFEFTPTGPVSSTLNTYVYNLDGSVASSGSTTLRASNPPVSPASPKRVMILGDSLAAAAVWPTELRRRLVGTGGTPAGLGLSNVEFIGNSAFSGAAGEGFFGYGGWTMAHWIGAANIVSYWFTAAGHDKDHTDQKAVYRDSNSRDWVMETIESGRIKFYASGHTSTPPASGMLTRQSGGTHTTAITYTAVESAPSTPLWNPTTNQFSIKHWVDTYNAGEGPDIIPVLLGWNGMPWSTQTGTAADHSANNTYIRTFLDTVKAEYPTAKVLLMSLPIPAPDGGLGTSYGASGSYSDFWRLRRMVSGYNALLRQIAADAAYSAMTTYVASGEQFDADYGYPFTNTPVNTRSAVTERRSTNGVHPSIEGYYQIADAAYRAMARLL